MKESRLIKNLFGGIIGQFLIVIFGFLIPRIIMKSYGSDVNGLLSTITQIFTYMALLEAGIGQAARNTLYKPITENNTDGISYVMSTAQRYFRKITVYYGIGVVFLAAIAPYILKSNVEKSTIFLAVLFEGLSGVISFFFIESISTLFAADGRGYVNSGITVVNKVLGYSVKILMAGMGINIVYVQFAYFVITIVKVIIYRIYLRKHYSWIDFCAAPKNARLADRNAYVITEIAWTLFSSTDMIVLSVFVSTKLSSVYGVYNMIFANLNVLLNAVYVSINYVLGQAYHKDLQEYEKVHDAFTSIFLGSMTVLMAVSYVLCIPFIRLYTRGITDINYLYEMLPLLFCLVQILSWSRYISGNLTGMAGYAKETSRVSLIEAMMNVVLSIILVSRFGIVGVLAATVAALPLKVLWCIYISDIKVMRRSCKKTAVMLGINYAFFGAVVWISRHFELNINGYGDFLLHAIVILIVLSAAGIGLNIAANPECVRVAKNLMGKGR